MKKTIVLASITSLLLASSAFAGSWEGSTEQGWKYLKDDGTYATSEWQQDSDGSWYYFDSESNMLHDQWIDGKYYVSSSGAMLHDTTTPDGYVVGSDGAWIEEEYASQPSSFAISAGMSDALYILSGGLESNSVQDVDVYQESDDTVGVKINLIDSSGMLNDSSNTYVKLFADYYASDFKKVITYAKRTHKEDIKVNVYYYYNDEYALTRRYSA